MKQTSVSVILLCLAAFSLSQVSSKCVYRASDHRLVNTSKLAHQGPGIQDYYTYASGHYYYFNPCGSTLRCPGNSLCRETYKGGQFYFDNLGDSESGTWSDSGGIYTLKVSPPSPNTVSVINFVCDSSVNTSFSVQSETMINNVTNYSFNFNLNCDEWFTRWECSAYTAKNNVVYDLLSLKNQGPFDGDFKVSDERFNYYFNPCSNNTNYVLESPINRYGCIKNSVCQSDISGSLDYPLGMPMASVWREESDTAILTLYGDFPGSCTSNGRTSEITFNCDYNSINPTFNLVSASYSDCFYKFRMDLNCSLYFNAPKPIIPTIPLDSVIPNSNRLTDAITPSTASSVSIPFLALINVIFASILL